MLHLDLEEFLVAFGGLELLDNCLVDGIRSRGLGPPLSRRHRLESRPDHLLLDLVVVAPRDPELPRRLRGVHLSHEDLHHDFHPLPVGGLLPLSP